MGKYYGKIGYSETEETFEGSGVWQENITEREYYGDVIQIGSRFSGADKLNDDISVSNKISVIADPYAYENFGLMRYVEWGGVKWKITNVEVQYPRLVLTLGGVYNEPQT